MWTRRAAEMQLGKSRRQCCTLYNSAKGTELSEAVEWEGEGVERE